MKTSPLPFNPQMARAWYADLKTQTRRTMAPLTQKIITDVSGETSNDPPDKSDVTVQFLTEGWRGPQWYVWLTEYPDEGAHPLGNCPYGGPGDRGWIRETLVPNPAGWVSYKDDGALALRDGRLVPWPWKVRKLVPRYMPRWACRSYGEILAVRAEPIQDISEADCCAELGAPATWPGPGPEPYRRDMRSAFATLWNKINAERGYPWSANNWVWALTLRRIPS